jgi:uncharacterized damage-inducible protein DinB
MQTFYKEYLNVLQTCHTDILKALDGLPPAALDWISGPEMNSISVLVFHLTGAERYWIGDVAVQEPSNRDRDAEFKVRDLEVNVLKKRLDDCLAYAHKALEKLTLQDLEESRVSPRDGHKFTVAWSLLHALEHANLHLGHIQIARQMWMESKGNIA